MNEKYDFGENEKLMQEVVEFAASSNFLKGIFKSEITDEIVTSPDKALDLAYDVFHLLGIDDFYGEKIEGDLSFAEVLAYLYSSEYNVIVESSYQNDFRKGLYSYDKELYRNIKHGLHDKEEIISGMVMEQLLFILEIRAVHGIKNKFFEKVFDVYKQGGLICGFRGDLQNEDWIIFYPIRDDIKPINELMAEFKEFEFSIGIIQEVLDVVYRPKLITGMIEPDEKNIVLTSFDEAWGIARDKKYNDEKDCWEEFISNESIKVMDKRKGTKYFSAIEDNIRGLYRNIYNVLLDSLDAPYEKTYSIIKECISAITGSRFSQGKSNKFFEELFWIYKNGGWPCGYQGDLEKGRFIVFYPTIIE